MAKNDLTEYREAHKDLIQFLEANVNKRAAITMVDGEKYQVLIDNVDSTGFVHYVDNEPYWTGFDSVQDYRLLPNQEA